MLGVPTASALAERIQASAINVHAGVTRAPDSFDGMLAKSMNDAFTLMADYTLDFSSVASEGAAVGDLTELDAAIA